MKYPQLFVKDSILNLKTYSVFQNANMKNFTLQITEDTTRAI